MMTRLLIFNVDVWRMANVFPMSRMLASTNMNEAGVEPGAIEADKVEGGREATELTSVSVSLPEYSAQNSSTVEVPADKLSSLE